MAVQFPTRPFTASSLFPAYSESCEEETSWTLKQFKKPYTTIGCFLSWAEKLTDPTTSHFLSDKRKVISKHSEMLNIPEWFKHGADLSESVGQVKKAQGACEKREAAAELFFNSLDFTKSSIGAASALNDADVISLAALSPALPPVLKGISSVSGLVLRTNDLYKQCMRTRKEYAKVPLKGVLEHLKQDKEAVWNLLSIVRVVATFVTAVLSAIGFFFAIKFSPYLALAFLTFTCIASLAVDLREVYTFDASDILPEFG